LKGSNLTATTNYVIDNMGRQDPQPKQRGGNSEEETVWGKQC
jgi:hypothetical protein